MDNPGILLALQDKLDFKSKCNLKVCSKIINQYIHVESKCIYNHLYNCNCNCNYCKFKSNFF